MNFIDAVKSSLNKVNQISNVKNKNKNNYKNKYSPNLYIILIIITLAKITLINSSQITSLNLYEKPCIYTFSDNTSVDLSPLRKEKDFTFPVGRYIYKGNFCGSQVDKCSGLNLPASIYIRRKLKS